MGTNASKPPIALISLGVKNPTKSNKASLPQELKLPFTNVGARGN